jgi:phosphoglycerate dehydrogenase-like enzyme
MKPGMNLLVTGAWKCTEAEWAALAALGHTLLYMPDESGPLPACLPDGTPVDAAWVEGVIANRLFLTHGLSEFPNLRYIQLTSAGLDRVPAEEIAARGITLRRAEGVYSIPMAEYALWGVLAVYKEAPRMSENQAAHRWEKQARLRELCGKRVLVVGCGSVGSACAERFAAMGCSVTGVTLHPKAPRRLPAAGCRESLFQALLPPDSLDDCLPRTDILILSCALSAATCHLIDSRRLALLPAGAVVVNLARGAVADTEALVAALTPSPTGAAAHLGGAVLDVFEEEPLPPSHPLWNCPGVVLTPHNAYAGEGNQARLFACIRAGLEEYEGTEGTEGAEGTESTVGDFLKEVPHTPQELSKKEGSHNP